VPVTSGLGTRPCRSDGRRSRRRIGGRSAERRWSRPLRSIVRRSHGRIGGQKPERRQPGAPATVDDRLTDPDCQEGAPSAYDCALPRPPPVGASS